MGMYDEYAGVQLKVGPCTLREYKMGEPVGIHDGVYVGYEGIVVVHEGILVAVHKNIYDKWGGIVSTSDILNAGSPLVQKLKELDASQNG